MAGRVDHCRRASVVDLEGMVGRPRKVVGEVDEELGRSPGVPVDHLVVVADPEAVESRCHQEPDQQEVSWRQVLELVDQHAAAPGLRCGSDRRVRDEDLDCTIDLLVEVDLPPIGQGRPVISEPVRDPGRVRIGLFGSVRCDQSEADEGQRSQEGRSGVGVGLALHLEQLADEVAHTYLVEHPQRSSRG